MDSFMSRNGAYCPSKLYNEYKSRMYILLDLPRKFDRKSVKCVITSHWEHDACVLSNSDRNAIN